MATRSINPSTSPGRGQQRAVPDPWSEPLPVPDVTEDNSDASWDLWREATQGGNGAQGGNGGWDADTEPMGLS